MQSAFKLDSCKPSLGHVYTVCVVTFTWILLQLTLTKGEIWGNDNIDFYLKFPLFLTVLNQTWTMCKQCAQ